MGEHYTVVLVTGSMRSGTSSLAGSLKHLGWHVPQPEVPASERNAKGHFEPRWVIEFHKRLMRRALVRPSDGSPRAEERLAALLGDGSVEAELGERLCERLHAEPSAQKRSTSSSVCARRAGGSAATSRLP